MNSGWTKVAAMATAFLEGEPDRAPHVIWDSRVSTAIVWRLDRMLAKIPGVDPSGCSQGWTSSEATSGPDAQVDAAHYGDDDLLVLTDLGVARRMDGLRPPQTGNALVRPPRTRSGLPLLPGSGQSFGQ